MGQRRDGSISRGNLSLGFVSLAKKSYRSTCLYKDYNQIAAENLYEFEQNGLKKHLAIFLRTTEKNQAKTGVWITERHI